MNCSLPGSSVHEILQAILEWVAIAFSRISSQPRDRIWVSSMSGIFFTIWAIRWCLLRHPASRTWAAKWIHSRLEAGKSSPGPGQQKIPKDKKSGTLHEVSWPDYLTVKPSANKQHIHITLCVSIFMLHLDMINSEGIFNLLIEDQGMFHHVTKTFIALCDILCFTDGLHIHY